MPLRTKLYMQFPWRGGLNRNEDEAVIAPGQLSDAANILIGESGSKKKRDGIKHNWDDVSTGSLSVVGQHDFWYGSSSRTQRRVAIFSDGSIRSYTSAGAASTITGGTGWSAPTLATMVTMNNLCIMATNEASTVVKKWSGTGNAADLGGTPPQGSILGTHLSRLWMNDKSNIDRLHYSETGNPEVWNGSGDSGAIDVGVGDGDPEGITCIMPTFRGELFVAKRTKLYRIRGTTPETFKVELVSNGIGCHAPRSAFLIDQSDVAFISERGVHSLAATDQFGDFDASFLSRDIQKDFNENWTKSRLKFACGGYLPSINSIAFAITHADYSETENKCVFLYNIASKEWYYWPNISCQSMVIASDTDAKRPYFGSSVSRISKGFNGTDYDISTSGVNTAILQNFATGRIFPEGNPYKIVHFKKLSLIHKPEGTHNITATVQIDNYPVQAVVFNEVGSAALLGSTFTLGSSLLGYNVVLAPYTQQIDGVGRSIKITFSTSGTSDPTEIWGFAVEYEDDGETAQEVII